MNAIDDAKREIETARNRFGQAVRGFFGSRIAVAVMCAFSFTFGCQLLYAADRPAPVAGLSLVQLGLPPVDLGRAGDVARDAGQAAMRNGLPEEIAGFFTDNPAIVPWFNGVGFALFVGLLLWTLYLQTRQYSRRPDALKKAV